MLKLVVIVVLVVAAAGYGMLFVSWNMAPTTVVGLRFSGQSYWQTAPLAYVCLVALGIGAVIVAFLWLCQWASQRSRTRRLSAQVAKAREVLDYQKRRITELEKGLADAQLARQEAVRPRESTATASPEPAAEGGGGEAADVLSVDLEPEGEAAGDDPEVI